MCLLYTLKFFRANGCAIFFSMSFFVWILELTDSLSWNHKSKSYYFLSLGITVPLICSLFLFDKRRLCLSWGDTCRCVSDRKAFSKENKVPSLEYKIHIATEKIERVELCSYRFLIFTCTFSHDVYNYPVFFLLTSWLELNCLTTGRSWYL